MSECKEVEFYSPFRPWWSPALLRSLSLIQTALADCRRDFRSSPTVSYSMFRQQQRFRGLSAFASTEIPTPIRQRSRDLELFITKTAYGSTAQPHQISRIELFARPSPQSANSRLCC